MKLEGKVALITGGARGFGRGFAEEVLENGGKVSLLDVLVDKGLDTANEFNTNYGQGSAMFMKCDVTNKQEFENAFKKTHDMFGQIDIVINNAGISGNGQDFMNPNWEKVIDIDLTAVIRGSILAHQYMSTDNGGQGGLLVNIASTAGLTGVAMSSIYGAAKHGVVGLSRSMALTVDGMGIRVSCLCPSFAKTDMVLGALGDTAQLPDMIKQMGLIEISDVVRAFRHVVDDDDVTGSVLAITPKGIEYKFPKNKKGARL